MHIHHAFKREACAAGASARLDVVLAQMRRAGLGPWVVFFLPSSWPHRERVCCQQLRGLRRCHGG